MTWIVIEWDTLYFKDRQLSWCCHVARHSRLISFYPISNLNSRLQIAKV